MNSIKQFFAIILFLLTACGKTEDKSINDPFLYLEENDNPQTIDWVKKENESIFALMDYAMYSEIDDKIFKENDTSETFIKGIPQNGYFLDYFSNGKIIQLTSPDEYLKPEPNWKPILDLNKLLHPDSDWSFKNIIPLRDDFSKLLLSLSQNGKDAVVTMEVDANLQNFVLDGFSIPESKNILAILNENSIIFGTDFGEESLNDAGYPRILKLWNRGEFVENASIIFEGSKSDLLHVETIQDGDKKHTIIMSYRSQDYQMSYYYLNNNKECINWNIFPNEALQDIKDNLVYLINTDNEIYFIPLNNDGTLNREEATILYDKRYFDLENKRILGFKVFDNKIDIIVWDYIKGLRIDRINTLDISESRTTTKEISANALPGTFTYIPKNELIPNSLPILTYSDFITPYTEFTLNEDLTLTKIRQAPHLYDSTNLEIVKKWTTSKDGTKVPYFLVKDKNLSLDGTNPTILDAYGGFGVIIPLDYDSELGKVWLEKGGVYAFANIRGGSELGLEWSMSAKRENRQKSFDDFIAVAEDLINTKVTSPKHLGIRGSSNGGLLVGVAMTQRPDLFNAVSISNPLLDMLRYTKLFAGNSWISEYGDPDDPIAREYLLKYSPYHNLKNNTIYPTPLFLTASNDDRVHPGHARKMAALMKSKNLPFFFYETDMTGHSSSMFQRSIEYTYFWKFLH